jgi:hypothetical protein
MLFSVAYRLDYIRLGAYTVTSRTCLTRENLHICTHAWIHTGIRMLTGSRCSSFNDLPIAVPVSRMHTLAELVDEEVLMHAASRKILGVILLNKTSGQLMECPVRFCARYIKL